MKIVAKHGPYQDSKTISRDLDVPLRCTCKTIKACDLRQRLRLLTLNATFFSKKDLGNHPIV